MTSCQDELKVSYDESLQKISSLEKTVNELKVNKLCIKLVFITMENDIYYNIKKTSIRTKVNYFVYDYQYE